MKYWPMTVLAYSPLLPAAYAPEVQQMTQRYVPGAPSMGAYLACVDVARRTPGIEAPNLAFIEHPGCAMTRRIFLDYPNDEEWLRMERSVLVEDDVGFTFWQLDALH